MDKPRNILPKTESLKSESPKPERFSTIVESSSKRRCISSACMPCRKRKSKCDGAQPTCNACLTVYSSQCYYDLDSDHRRKGALKRDIAQLKDELSAQATILEALRRAGDADIDDIINLVRANPDESYETIAENIQRMSISTRPKPHLIPSASTSSGLESELADLSAKPSLDQKTGDLRHYGHTSNFNYYHNSMDSEHLANAGDQPEPWTTVTNDAEFINHLLDRYFAWQHPFYLLFSEEVFYHGLHDRKRKYCTPLLFNAILATACNFSDRPEARADPNDPASAGAHFFAEAKRLLYEDQRASLTSVQALGLMSLSQAMVNEDGPGWQYAGQMMSMTTQLGLHMQSAAEPNMTATEIEARRVTFWGVFTVDTFWSICVGRLSSIPVAAIRLERPKLLSHLEEQLWKPHGMPGYDGSNHELHQPSHKYSILVQSSLLAAVLDDVLRMFYAPRDRITSRRLQLHHGKLQAWYDNLPATLRINQNGPTLPQVFALHIYYHNSVINLFRPFIKVTFVQNAKPPRQICNENAVMISQLLEQYVHVYGLKPAVFILTHCAVSAGIIHLLNISSAPDTISSTVREQSETHLIQAMRLVHSTIAHYPIVDRYLKSLTGLIYKWCVVITPRLQQALAEVQASPPLHTTVQTEASKQTAVWMPTPPNDHEFSRAPPPVASMPSSNSNENVNNAPFLPPSRKHSAPDLVRMAPASHTSQLHNEPSPLPFTQMQLPNPSHSAPPQSSTSQYQQIFWTPFPETFDGVPLAMLDQANNLGGLQQMSVTGMLGGEFPQLSQDGFMLESESDKLFHQTHGAMKSGSAGNGAWEWR